MDIRFIIFACIATITIGSALVVAFSRNLVHSAFALLGVFAGVLGLYILLSADFVAIVQLVIYIGGILILILFAVLLTKNIGDVKISNRSISPVLAIIAVASLGTLLWKALSNVKWIAIAPEEFRSTTSVIGQMLLTEYLLPFEIISLLLILVLAGALVIARREVK